MQTFVDCAESSKKQLTSCYYLSNKQIVPIQAFRTAVLSLGTNGGLQSFLESLAELHVKATNTVLAYNPKKSPEQLRVKIVSEWYTIDHSSRCAELFRKAWNDAVQDCPPDVRIEGPWDYDQWRWVVDPLVICCHRALSEVIRIQFDDEPKADTIRPTIADAEDLRHAYYYVGAVWRRVLRHFGKSTRVTSSIESMFLSKAQAIKENLPVEEINSR